MASGSGVVMCSDVEEEEVHVGRTCVVGIIGGLKAFDVPDSTAAIRSTFLALEDMIEAITSR